MRHSIRVATLLVAAPIFASNVLAADVQPAAAAKPAPAMYQVSGLKWDGRHYAAQPGYSLTTPNLKQATDYAAQFNCFPGWSVTTNFPAAIGTQQNFARSFAPPDGNGSAFGAPTANVPPYILNWLYSVGIQPSQLQASAAGSETEASVPSAGVDVSTYGDTSDIDRMIATQDMINRQQEFNNMQDMLNTQNFINTENMINNMQNDVNTQNMVNEQNMINAMNNP
ncbi:MAG TPA: hypothetical protein VGP76_16990 [Planctomycetaceae bacterium]|jgi:hypothetical protein|nr:hypothetical protein [Planctomycetaceae bacterium]